VERFGRFVTLQRVFDRRQQVRQEDVPVAGIAQFAGQPLHFAAQKFILIGRHQVAEQTEGGVRAGLAFAQGLDLPGAGRATSELVRRIDALAGLGLGYLDLDRPIPTLSRGEAQRVRIAQILVNRLEDLLHVLDEPSIGLHPREVKGLLDTLAQLPGPVVMVEHDPRAAALADDAIEIGPGAGDEGGRIVFRGTPAALWKADTVSGRRFSEERPPIGKRQAATNGSLVVRDASLRNLRGVTCSVPIGKLTVITGPSGAGKTTLARDVVLASVEEGKAIGCDGIDGPSLRPVMVDQSPIGNNPRSNPATYTKVLDRIRNTFAKATGVSASAFSFSAQIRQSQITAAAAGDDTEITHGRLCEVAPFEPQVRQVAVIVVNERICLNLSARIGHEHGLGAHGRAGARNAAHTLAEFHLAGRTGQHVKRCAVQYRHARFAHA
jgi:excinuclease UvrABC ATPase subunit